MTTVKFIIVGGLFAQVKIDVEEAFILAGWKLHKYSRRWTRGNSIIVYARTIGHLTGMPHETPIILHPSMNVIRIKEWEPLMAMIKERFPTIKKFEDIIFI